MGTPTGNEVSLVKLAVVVVSFSRPSSLHRKKNSRCPYSAQHPYDHPFVGPSRLHLRFADPERTASDVSHIDWLWHRHQQLLPIMAGPKRRASLLALLGLCNLLASLVLAMPMIPTTPAAVPIAVAIEARAPEPLETRTLLLIYSTSYTTETVSTASTLEKTLTKTVTKTATASRPPPSHSGPITPPVRTYTRTSTVTASTTLALRLRAKRQTQDDGQSVPEETSISGPAFTNMTTTTIVSTWLDETSTETNYTSTATKYVTTTTKFTTFTPTGTETSLAESRGLWTQIKWVVVTETVQPTLSIVQQDEDNAGPVNIGVVAGSTVASVTVLVAAMAGACVFMRRRNMKREKDKRAQKREAKRRFEQGGAYSRVVSDSEGSRGLGIGTPESQGLMGGGFEVPTAGVGNFHRAPQTPATPGPSNYGHFTPSPPLDSSSVPPLPPHLNAPGVNIIPPSSTASLRTTASPTTSAYFASPGTSPAAMGRYSMYSHLSPLTSTSEFSRSPDSASRPSSHERSDSISDNIMPPPLQGYRPTSDVSSASTTLRGQYSACASPVSSVRRPNRGGQFEDAGQRLDEEKPLVSPMSPPSRSGTWGKSGDPVKRTKVGEGPSRTSSVPSLPPIARSTTPPQDWLLATMPEQTEPPKQRQQPQDQLGQSYYW
jgi:hypothetical protein